MRRAIGILLGALVGGPLGIATLLGLGQVGDGPILRSRLAVAIGTPAAHVVCQLNGWPLEQEAGLVCYTIGLLATFALVGAAAGAATGALVAGRSEPTAREPR